MYYAYWPKPDGSAPLGTEGQSIRRDLKTDRGAVAWARRLYGDSVRVFRVIGDSFYDDGAFRQIYGTPDPTGLGKK